MSCIHLQAETKFPFHKQCHHLNYLFLDERLGLMYNMKNEGKLPRSNICNRNRILVKGKEALYLRKTLAGSWHNQHGPSTILHSCCRSSLLEIRLASSSPARLETWSGLTSFYFEPHRSLGVSTRLQLFRGQAPEKKGRRRNAEID